MKRNIIFPILVLLIIEALIIYGMMVLPWPIPVRVRILDMAVLTVVVLAFGYDFFRPIINLAVKNAPEVGSLGVRWFGQILYFLCAVGLIIAGIYVPIPFIYQLLGQLAILCILLLTYFFASKAGSMVTEVAQEEEAVLSGRQQMRTAIRKIRDEIEIEGNVPDYFRSAIVELEEKLRYVSPSNNPEAAELENQFEYVASRIILAMSNYQMNEDSIRKDLLRLQRLLDNRKQIYN